ncbi:MAG: bacteriohemerythrin [Roseburia inulinivorans]
MYEFTEDCMLHIDAIDEEHKRLFQMINEAFELVEKTEDVTAIGQSLIANLKDYAATHLAHEEAYMESIHDPELPLQKTEHAAFAKTINEFKLDTTSPRNAKRSLNELLTYLVHWLYHHILSRRYDDRENDPYGRIYRGSICIHGQIQNRHHICR